MTDGWNSEFFPGSKRRRDTSTPDSEVDPAVVVQSLDLEELFAQWDDGGIDVVLGGEIHTMYKVGTLCKALNRRPPTIREWERHGHIPPAMYRSAGKRRNRLYTKAQILGLHLIAKEEGLLDPKARVPIESTSFGDRAFKLFAAL